MVYFIASTIDLNRPATEHISIHQGLMQAKIVKIHNPLTLSCISQILHLLRSQRVEVYPLMKKTTTFRFWRNEHFCGRSFDTSGDFQSSGQRSPYPYFILATLSIAIACP